MPYYGIPQSLNLLITKPFAESIMPLGKEYFNHSPTFEASTATMMKQVKQCYVQVR